ncbi:MAG: glycosyltransferase family 4 protein [Aeromicrobium sp.]
MMRPTNERVVYIVRSWPRLSQTFIVNEVLALERRGVPLDVVSLVRSGETVVQPQVADVRAPISYLDEPEPRGRLHRSVFAAAPGRYLAALTLVLRRPGLAAGYGDCSALECFNHAVWVAAHIRMTRATHVHAHFAHDPALVGLLAARLAGVPFSFTGHARDLYQIPALSLAARAEHATTLVTCCEANVSFIRETVPGGARIPVQVVHHGVDLDRFSPDARQGSRALGGGVDSADDDRAPVLVSVGRLIEKKGFDDLLRALARIDSPFSLRIYGDGPLHDELVRLRDELGLAGSVDFMGGRDSDEIVAALTGADAFVLTPTTTEDGDRDGIPNVLVEAMACGLPVVTTTAGGITELVEHGVNGLLCDPEDVTAIAGSIGEVLADPELRSRLGAAGRRAVEADYDVNVAAARLDAIYSPPAQSQRARSSAELEVAQ